MNPLIAPEAQPRDARCALSVNVNKVALLRNTRPLGIPVSRARPRRACKPGRRASPCIRALTSAMSVRAM